MRFTKMHGLGNDFIIFDAPAAGAPDAGTIRRLADRHTGIGFDQALMLEPPRRADTEVYYRIFNADGHEVEQCGNGARCIARHLFERRGGQSPELVLDSPGGTVQARVQGAQVAVTMGIPDFNPAALPFEASGEAYVYPLAVGAGEVEIGAVSVGNPHAVIRREPDAAEVRRLGPLVERHPRFPGRTNVQLVRVDGLHDVTIGVWERGAGETLASGSSATAVAAAAVAQGWCESPVTVHLAGGDLVVAIDRDDSGGLVARQTGEAQEICSIELSPELLADLA